MTLSYSFVVPGTIFLLLSAHAGDRLGKKLPEGVLVIFYIAVPHCHY